MSEDEKRIAQSIRLIEQEHEAGDASAGDRAHDQRQNDQEREAPALAFSFALSLQFRNHSRAYGSGSPMSASTFADPRSISTSAIAPV